MGVQSRAAENSFDAFDDKVLPLQQSKQDIVVGEDTSTVSHSQGADTRKQTH